MWRSRFFLGRTLRLKPKKKSFAQNFEKRVFQVWAGKEVLVWTRGIWSECEVRSNLRNRLINVHHIEFGIRVTCEKVHGPIVSCTTTSTYLRHMIILSIAFPCRNPTSSSNFGIGVSNFSMHRKGCQTTMQFLRVFSKANTNAARAPGERVKFFLEV